MSAAKADGRGDAKGRPRDKGSGLWETRIALSWTSRVRLANGMGGVAERLTRPAAPAKPERGSPGLPASPSAGACLTFPGGLVVAAGHGGG